MTETNEWVDVERKVPDQVGPYGNGPAFQTVHLQAAGKGRKGKARQIALRIPRNMLKQEIKRWFNTALFDNATIDSPAGTPLKTNSFGTITSGGGAINRLGDAILVHEVVFRYMITPDAASTWTVADLAWLIDNEPAVGLSNWNVPFNTIGAGSAALYNVAIPAYDTRFRYKQLQRETIPMCNRALMWNGASTLASVLPQVGTVRLKLNRRVMYDATNAVYAGCELPFYAWSSGGAAKLFMSVEVFFSDA